MKKLLFLVALLGTLLSSSPAEVLIYKGSGTARVKAGEPIPPAIQMYFVVEIPNENSASVGYITFFKSAGQKRQRGPFVEPKATTTVPQAGGGTRRIISSAVGTSSPPNFTHLLFHLRGVQKSIVVLPGITRNEPRVFDFLETFTTKQNGISNFTEFRVRAVYDETRTVKANSDGKTIHQATDDLAAELEAKGYQKL